MLKSLMLLIALSPVPRETSVGMTGRIEQLVLPGTELEAIPDEERKLPIVLRIVRTYPHGTAFRYDLEYYGLEPGDYDLKNYLRRKDDSPTSDLPSLPVRITPLLPPGQITPHDLESQPAPSLGGYRKLRIAAGAIWIIGLIAIIYFGFVRRRRTVAVVEQRPVTLADRLRPLIDGAIAGRLSQAELASLERSLLAFWRKRLKLEDTEPALAIERLRQHPESGPLLHQLELWLHRPGTSEKVDPVELLKPYQQWPANSLEG